MNQNREIKFRAWDKKENRMIGWDKLRKEFDVVVDYWERFNLMQFTGLNDRHGKEIYEGDIILWQAPFFEKRFEVKWSDKKCGFSIKPKYLNEMKVIGNVWE